MKRHTLAQTAAVASVVAVGVARAATRQRVRPDHTDATTLGHTPAMTAYDVGATSPPVEPDHQPVPPWLRNLALLTCVVVPALLVVSILRPHPNEARNTVAATAAATEIYGADAVVDVTADAANGSGDVTVWLVLDGDRCRVDGTVYDDGDVILGRPECDETLRGARQ